MVELDLSLIFKSDGKFAKSFRHLGRLKSSKVLKLDLRFKSAAPLCAVLTTNAIPIEHLKLTDGIIDAKAVKDILQMKRLKVLELDCIEGLTDEHIIELAKELGTRLEKLQLEDYTVVNITKIGLKKMLPFAKKLSFLTLKPIQIRYGDDDYQAMLKMVLERPEKCSLLIELTGAGGQIKVSDAILMKNCDIFYIDEKIVNDSDSDDNNSSDEDESMEF